MISSNEKKYVSCVGIFEHWRGLAGNRYLLSGTESLLVFELLMMFFKAGWPEVLSVTTAELMQLLGVTERTFYKVRKKLKELGLILHEPGKRHFVAAYFLGEIFHKSISSTSILTEESEVKEEVLKDKENRPPSLGALLVIWESLGQKIGEYEEGQLGILLRQFDVKKIVNQMLQLKKENKLAIVTLRKGLLYGKDSWRSNKKQSITTNGSGDEKTRNSYTSVGRAAPTFTEEDPGDSSGSEGSDRSDR